MSRGVALSVQVDIQLFLHVLRNFLGNWAMLCTCHMLGEHGDKRNILCHMLGLHNIHCVVAVMDGCGIAGCETSKGNCRNALISKWSGIA